MVVESVPCHPSGFPQVLYMVLGLLRLRVEKKLQMKLGLSLFAHILTICLYPFYWLISFICLYQPFSSLRAAPRLRV